MKLSVELVPKTSWFKNLRSMLTPGDWDRLRRGTYRKADYRCEICDGQGPNHPVECHEIWHYDDKRHQQILTGLIALCPACHQVKHIGLASIQGKFEQALNHLMQVNRWTEHQAIRHIKAAGKKQRERNKFKWEVDISWVGVDRG